ncbi:MAG: hypothetical protein QM784_21345 [Polyangiaceae bacterium]
MSRKMVSRLGLTLLGMIAAACSDAGRDDGSIGGAEGQPLLGTDFTPSSANDVFDSMRTGTGTYGIDKMLDGNVTTFAQFGDFKDTITYQLAKPAILTNYEITSASDAATPERDPMDWTLEGSLNGVDWVPLDSRSGILFEARSQTKLFSFTNSTPYVWVRLRITKINWPDTKGMLQIGEFRVGGTAPAVATPTITAIGTPVVDSNLIALSWTATSATSFILRRYSEDGGSSAEIPCSGTSYKDSDLLPGTAYAYTIQPLNGTVRGLPYKNAIRTVTPQLAGGLKDLTALSDVPPTADHEDPTWPATHLTDGYVVSKWYAGTVYDTGRLRQEVPADAVVTQYTLTSADDNPNRDPKSWELWGSKDGTTFDVLLDSRKNQVFYGRRETRTFACNANGLPSNSTNFESPPITALPISSSPSGVSLGRRAQRCPRRSSQSSRPKCCRSIKSLSSLPRERHERIAKRPTSSSVRPTPRLQRTSSHARSARGHRTLR